MTDTTITKIDSTHSPIGAAGQKYLACGKSMSMRLWENEPIEKEKNDCKRDYETLGFVIKGKAELHLEGQMVLLNAGDSWVVPKGASHHYKILEEFSAVESTSPPAELHDRAASDRCNSPKEFFRVSARDADEVKSVEPVKGDSPAMKAKAHTETKADADAKQNAKPEVQHGAKPDTKQDAPLVAKADAQETKKECDDSKKSCAVEASDQSAKEKEDDKDTDGQTCDPNTKECHPGKHDGEEGDQAKEENPDKDKSSENKAEKSQEIVAQIPRTDSKPTSNAAEKEPKPAEHLDVNAKGDDKQPETKPEANKSQEESKEPK